MFTTSTKKITPDLSRQSNLEHKLKYQGSSRTTFHVGSRVVPRSKILALRFVLDYMTEKAVQERLVKLLETDWKAKAAILLEERLAAVAAGEEAYVSPLSNNGNQLCLLTMMTRLLNFEEIPSR